MSITTDINPDGIVAISSEDEMTGNQTILILPGDGYVELIIAGRHSSISYEALAELTAQFTAILEA